MPADPVTFALACVVRNPAMPYLTYVKEADGKTNLIAKGIFGKMKKLKGQRWEKKDEAATEILQNSLDMRYNDYVLKCLEEGVSYYNKVNFRAHQARAGMPPSLNPGSYATNRAKAQKRIYKSGVYYVQHAWTEPDVIEAFPFKAIREVLEKINLKDKMGWELVKYSEPEKIELRSVNN